MRVRCAARLVILLLTAAVPVDAYLVKQLLRVLGGYQAAQKKVDAEQPEQSLDAYARQAAWWEVDDADQRHSVHYAEAQASRSDQELRISEEAASSAGQDPLLSAHEATQAAQVKRAAHEVQAAEAAALIPQLPTRKEVRQRREQWAEDTLLKGMGQEVDHDVSEDAPASRGKLIAMTEPPRGPNSLAFHPKYKACVRAPRSCRQLFLPNASLTGPLPYSLNRLTMLTRLYATNKPTLSRAHAPPSCVTESPSRTLAACCLTTSWTAPSPSISSASSAICNTCTPTVFDTVLPKASCTRSPCVPASSFR